MTIRIQAVDVSPTPESRPTGRIRTLVHAVREIRPGIRRRALPELDASEFPTSGEAEGFIRNNIDRIRKMFGSRTGEG